MAKRLFDMIFSLILIVLLSPLFMIISLIIVADSKGGVFFLQKRIGKKGVPFRMIKFRTMQKNAEKSGLLTVGMNDKRITNSGYYLRKYKLDEIPQLFNVFLGEMSFVGPRPEVQKYVDLYDEDQKKVLLVRPGITDPASIAYFKENELLKDASDPERTYIQSIMPEKIKINIEYLKRRTFFSDLGIILKTFHRMIKR